MLNGEAGWGEFSKIFDSEDFGYREIRVERPLKLAFQVTAEGLEALQRAKPFLKLAHADQEKLLEVVGSGLPAGQRWLDRGEFVKAFEAALKKAGLRIGAPVKKLVLQTFSERDENAAVCTGSDGKPEADTELRDHELVPLNEDWIKYVDREVLPFVPDAWVDEEYRDEKDGGIGYVGYEINFNRYFYKYVPPRPLAEIDAELQSLEAEIAGLLKGVAG